MKKMIKTIEFHQSNDCNIETKDFLIIIRNLGDGFYFEMFNRLTNETISSLTIRHIKNYLEIMDSL